MSKNLGSASLTASVQKPLSLCPLVAQTHVFWPEKGHKILTTGLFYRRFYRTDANLTMSSSNYRNEASMDLSSFHSVLFFILLMRKPLNKSEGGRRVLGRSVVDKEREFKYRQLSISEGGKIRTIIICLAYSHKVWDRIQSQCWSLWLANWFPMSEGQPQ